MKDSTQSVSIVVPTFNGASRIGACLNALLQQESTLTAEIVVVNDGSNDDTEHLVKSFSGIHLINQANAGPAAARNRGVRESRGDIIIFTDDDCVPAPDWLEAMTAPFTDANIAGVKGIYRTRQKQLIARFIQIEYEDRYRRMARFPSIDFIDTYSAAFRRKNFLDIGGFDTGFPVACAEDAELSYRMSSRKWTMRFAPQAIVYHTHPANLWQYLKKKYKFAYWRVLATRKNPQKAFRDSHTPQLMKLQMLFPPALLLAMAADLTKQSRGRNSLAVACLFLGSTLPFAFRAARKDPMVGLVSPALLALRACAQALGVSAGLLHASRNRSRIPAKSAA
jgi:glycosyltransferase involved in cell wall biosynthesis